MAVRLGLCCWRGEVRGCLLKDSHLEARENVFFEQLLGDVCGIDPKKLTLEGSLTRDEAQPGHICCSLIVKPYLKILLRSPKLN
jgi:hypothetical protein